MSAHPEQTHPPPACSRIFTKRPALSGKRIQGTEEPVISELESQVTAARSGRPLWATRRAGALWPWPGTLLAVALVACSSATVDGDAPSATGLPLQPCQLRAPGSNDSLSATCGRLEVALSAEDGDARTLGLQVAVQAAVSRNAAPDPLYYLAGGPGQAASETYPASAYAFQRIRQRRDIVLVDQRGTGASGALRCEPEAEGSDSPTADRALAISEWAQGCVASLDADLSHYTTADAVRDLEASADALGYQQVNVYGISYGSRLAQAWARAHPERVRSLVLDGVVPLEHALGGSIARDAQTALDLIFDRCARDPDCDARYGSLAPRFDRLMEALDGEPVLVRLDHPVRAEAIEIEIDRERAATVFRFASYSPETVALIPLLVDAAEGRADFRPLAAQYLLLTEALDQSIANGLHYAIVCSEDVPYFAPDPIAASNAESYLGNFVTDSLQLVCSSWPAAPMPPGLHVPLRGGPPSLMLSGAVDPVTPPRNAEQVGARLREALQLVAPGQGHGVVGRGCIPSLVAEFVEAGSSLGIDASCVDAIEPDAFFLDPSGPAP